MKEFFITILIILMFLGVPILLACTPLLLRDGLRRRNRKDRHRNFKESHDHWCEKGTVFEVTIRLCKEELKEAISLEQRLHYPMVSSIIVSLLMLCWVIGGSIGIREMITGEEPATLWGWLYNLFGVVAGALILFAIWLGAFTARRSVDQASEFEISEATERKYTITPESLHVSIEGEQLAATDWQNVDFVVEEAGALRIHMVSREFLVIPRDALFHQGHWDELRELLEPLRKNGW